MGLRDSPELRSPTLEEIAEAAAIEAIRLGSCRLPLDYEHLDSMAGDKFPFEEEVGRILENDSDPDVRRSQYPHRNLTKAVVLILKRNPSYDKGLVVVVKESKEPRDVNSVLNQIVIHRRDSVILRIKGPERLFAINSKLIQRRG